MTALAKSEFTLESVPSAPASDDIAIGDLLDRLSAHAAKRLVFFYEGRPVRPGYHVTEVKAGRFAGLDCGANPEAWSEIFIQLWDIEEGDRTHMPAGKFAAIIRKVSEHVALDPAARLTFEVSDGVAPMRLHRAGTPRATDDEIHVDLSPRAASCKPRDRWLAEQKGAKAAGCCGPASGEPCCA